MNKKYEMMMKVAADSPEKMTASAFERYLEECQSAGYNLKKAKEYVLSFNSLNPYTKERVEEIYTQFVANK